MPVLVSIALLVFLLWLLVKHAKAGYGKKPLTVPQGEHEVRVYTYNGLPIKRYKIKEPFLVEMISEETSMKSVYTDTVWKGRFGVKAQGLQFGFADSESIMPSYICELGKYYKPVQVHAANVWGFGKWPYVVLLLPEADWFKDALKKAREDV